MVAKASHSCGSCHGPMGNGGKGANLAQPQLRRSAAHLREALLEPEATVPGDFLLLRVVTRDGRVLGGVRVNEDGFSIQFRDLSGQLHSFWKDELETLEQQWQRSPMASYEASIAAEQMDDLVAYLVSLKGAQ